jgi:hypothetical protein
MTMPGDNRKALRHTTEGKRNTSQARNGNGGRDAWNQLDLNAIFRSERPLLGAASKDERITALQTPYRFSGKCMVPDEAENLILSMLLLALMLADINQFRIRSG